MLALPLIISVYVGIAESAKDIAIRAAKKRKPTPALIAKVGQMEEHLQTARIALADMLLESPGEPDIHSTSRILIDRTIAGEASRATVEMAVQVAGAASYMRDHPLERLFRDVQAVRFHPLDPALQRDLAGRVALSLNAEPTQSNQLV
jgi:acyl-CoA dehydrogenase